MAAKANALRHNNSSKVKSIGKELRKSLQQDRQEKIWEVSSQIEARLAVKDVIGVYDLIRPWYRKYKGKPPVLSEENLENVKNVYEDCFTKYDCDKD